jgi:ketosteroid isomerase-like protein
MSQENVEKVRRAYEAFNRGDSEGMVADVAPEFEYVGTGLIPGVGGAYSGAEGLRQFLESFWGEFDEPRVEIRELIEAGDQVVAALTFQGRGKQSGVETKWDLWHVLTLRDGLAVRQQAFTSESEALEAVGLSE